MEKELDTRNNILHYALDLFSSKGYDAVGVAQLSDAAGITKPTLYYYFGSKEGVFKAILEEYYGYLNSDLSKKAVYIAKPDEYEKDIYPVLIKIADTYFQFAKEHTNFYLMMMTQTFSPKSSVSSVLAKPYLDKNYEIVENVFRDFSKVHTNLFNKERRLARNFVALIHSEIVSWNYGDNKLDKEEKDCLVRQFMHGIFA